MKGLKKEGARYVIGVLLFLCVLGLGFTQQAKQFLNIPTSIVLFEGNQAVIETSSVEIKNNHDTAFIQNSGNHSQLHATEIGETEAVVKMGNWPIKAIDVAVLPEIKVVPGGQSIGVKLTTEGVLVVGHHLLIRRKGKNLLVNLLE